MLDVRPLPRQPPDRRHNTTRSWHISWNQPYLYKIIHDNHNSTHTESNPQQNHINTPYYTLKHKMKTFSTHEMNFII